MIHKIDRHTGPYIIMNAVKIVCGNIKNPAQSLWAEAIETVKRLMSTGIFACANTIVNASSDAAIQHYIVYYAYVSRCMDMMIECMVGCCEFGAQ